VGVRHDQTYPRGGQSHQESGQLFIQRFAPEPPSLSNRRSCNLQIAGHRYRQNAAKRKHNHLGVLLVRARNSPSKYSPKKLGHIPTRRAYQRSRLDQFHGRRYDPEANSSTSGDCGTPRTKREARHTSALRRGSVHNPPDLHRTDSAFSDRMASSSFTFTPCATGRCPVRPKRVRRPVRKRYSAGKWNHRAHKTVEAKRVL